MVSGSVEDVVDKLGFGKFQLLLILLFGCVSCAVAAEMMLLSFLGGAVSCDWRLSDARMALLTTFFFLGNMVGAPLWGRLADRLGRRAIVVLTLLLLSYASLMTAFAPNFLWLSIMRSAVGFAVSGMVVLSPYLSEFLPVKRRANSLMATNIFWSLGTILVVCFSYVMMPRFGWRLPVGLIAAPVFLSTFCFLKIPESPRHLLVIGETERAQTVFDSMANSNGMDRVKIAAKEERAESSLSANFLSLFHPRYRLTTSLLWFVWFGCGFCYYGSVLTAAEFPNRRHRCLQDRRVFSSASSSLPFGREDDDNSCCAAITYESFVIQIVAASGEIFTLLFTCMMLEAIGRRGSLIFNALLGATSFFCLNFCMPPLAEAFLFFVGRAANSSLFSVAYIYVTEVYPTSVRAFALGCCSSAARVGALLTPFVAQVLMKDVSVLGATLVYVGVLVSMAVVAFLLPIETRKRALLQTVHSRLQEETPDNSYKTFEKKE